MCLLMFARRSTRSNSPIRRAPCHGEFVSATDAIVTPVPAAAQELETHLRSRRHAVSALVSLDGEDRWGYPGPERLAQMQEEAAELNERIRVAEAAMTEQVARLRESDPMALEAWIAAQELLLDAYLQELAQYPDPDRVRTEVSVAQGERKSWAKVRAGKIAFVDQNSFYVRPSRHLYEQLFGLLA
jgi:hypothetical protein